MFWGSSIDTWHGTREAWRCLVRGSQHLVADHTWPEGQHSLAELWPVVPRLSRPRVFRRAGPFAVGKRTSPIIAEISRTWCEVNQRRGSRDENANCVEEFDKCYSPTFCVPIKIIPESTQVPPLRKWAGSMFLKCHVLPKNRQSQSHTQTLQQGRSRNQGRTHPGLSASPGLREKAKYSVKDNYWGYDT